MADRIFKKRHQRGLPEHTGVKGAGGAAE